MLLREKVGVPLCFLVIKRPCFERQVRKTRHYTNVVGYFVKILHMELFPGSSAVLVLFTQWVLYSSYQCGSGFGDSMGPFLFLRSLALLCGPAHLSSMLSSVRHLHFCVALHKSSCTAHFVELECLIYTKKRVVTGKVFFIWTPKMGKTWQPTPQSPLEKMFWVRGIRNMDLDGPPWESMNGEIKRRGSQYNVNLNELLLHPHHDFCRTTKKNWLHLAPR